MNKRKITSENVTPRLLNTDELMAYSGLGRNKSVILGDEIGAREFRLGNAYFGIALKSMRISIL